MVRGKAAVFSTKIIEAVLLYKNKILINDKSVVGNSLIYLNYK